MNDDPECPGADKCHGCLKWCDLCGDVAHVCDTRLRGEVCAEHPVPETASIIRTARAAAERKIADGIRMQREGEEDLREVVAASGARRIYESQRAEVERSAMEQA
jgi:hypothetical protein